MCGGRNRRKEGGRTGSVTDEGRVSPTVFHQGEGRKVAAEAGGKGARVLYPVKDLNVIHFADKKSSGAVKFTAPLLFLSTN